MVVFEQDVVLQGLVPPLDLALSLRVIRFSSNMPQALVKSMIEQMATVGYKELNDSGEFVTPEVVKM